MIENKLNMFQSLIGILQTELKRRVEDDISIVSIPHRYSTNWKNNTYGQVKLYLFQSLIGILQTDQIGR